MGNRLKPFLRFMGLGLSGLRAINEDVTSMQIENFRYKFKSKMEKNVQHL